MDETQIVYQRGDLTADELRAELREFFAVAADDPAARQDANEARVDLDEVLSSGPEQLEVKPADADLAGFEEALIILLLTPPVQTAWGEVVLPWLRRRRNRPVGDEVPSEK